MDQQRMLDYKLRGYCCSQIVTEAGLELLGKENPDMVRASAGMCMGMTVGANCGTLTAAMCILHLANPKEADQELCRDLLEWFETTYESIECDIITGGDPWSHMEFCGQMVSMTVDKLAELLQLD